MSKNVFNCFICEKDFIDPRLLPCFHTFCRQCLNNTITIEFKNGMIDCPLCQETVKVPKDGANGFLINSFLRKNGKFDRTVLCSICDEDNYAISKCNDCRDNFCRRCLSVHNKVEGTAYHAVMSVSSASPDLCQLHDDKTLDYFCRSCKEVICTLCIRKYHSAHDVTDIETASRACKDKLYSSIDETERFEDLTTSAGEQRKVQKEEDNVIDAIHKQTKVFKEIVDEVRREFTRQLLEAASDAKTVYEKTHHSRFKSNVSFNQLSLFAKHFIKNANDYDVMKYGPLLNEKLQNMNAAGLSYYGHAKMKFTPKKVSFDDVKMLFGYFTPSSNRDQMNVTRFFHCSMEDCVITSITYMPDNTVWACFGSYGILENYTEDGKKIGQLTLRNRVDDTACSRDGVLYITCNAGKKILSLNERGPDKWQTYINTESCARGIDIDKQNQIIVGLTESDVFFNAKRYQVGNVVAITRGKTIIKMYTDELIQYPARIAVNKNGDVAVCDWISLTVLIFRAKKKIGYFNGKDDGFPHFTPRGICATKDCGFIVVDAGSNHLHWITERGKLKRSMNCRDRLLDPYSVTVDKQDNVWVGTKDANIAQLCMCEKNVSY